MKRRVAARIIVGWDDRDIDTNRYINLILFCRLECRLPKHIICVIAKIYGAI